MTADTTAATDNPIIIFFLNFSHLLLTISDILHPKRVCEKFIKTASGMYMTGFSKRKKPPDGGQYRKLFD